MFIPIPTIIKYLKLWPFQLILMAFAISGVLYLAPKAISAHENGLDFRLIWLAGKQWAAGGNPYGHEFLVRYFEMFGSGPNTHFWVYPPYWWPLAVPLSFFPFPTAFAIWRVTNFAILIWSTYLVSRAIANVSRQQCLPIFYAGLGYVCMMQATAVTIAIGQTSIIVYFGICLMFYALLEKRPQILIAALTCLALKPNIGVVAAAAIVVLRPYRWTLIPVGIICTIASIPSFIGTQPGEVISSFFANLIHYNDGSLAANRPPNLTGLIHLSAYIFGHPVSSAALILVAISSVAMTSYLSVPDAGDDDSTASRLKLSGLALILVLIFFLVPLHSYDLVPCAALLMINVAVPLPGLWLVIIGILICVRAGNLADATSIVNPASDVFHASLLLSTGLLVILLGSLLGFLHSKTRENPDTRRTLLLENANSQEQTNGDQPSRLV